VWKLWLVALFVALGLLVVPIRIEAATSADITITATGFIVGAPGGLTLTYVSDYELGISWTKGENAENTIIRVKYGSYPEDRNDGYLVYYGNETSTTDTNINLAGISEMPYYRAWSQRSDGVWEETGIWKEANFMSQSFLFLTLVILGLGLFLAAFRWKDMLLSYSAALTWMAIGFWWILGDITVLQLEDPWVKILVFIPFILAFTVLLRLMNVEIQMEAKGRKWTEWGESPGRKSSNYLDRYWEYKKELRRRLRR